MPKINVIKIAERMEKSSIPSDTESWMDNKNIDDKSLDNYLAQLSTQGLKMVLGELSVTNDRDAATREIYNLIGTAFQLGYMTCEIQFERSYLSGDNTNDG